MQHDYPISHDFHALFSQQEGRRLPVDINPSPDEKVAQKRQIEAVGCPSCYHHTMGFCACREQADVESNGRGCHDWIHR